MADVTDIIQRIVIQAEDQATAVIARVAAESKAAFGGLSDAVAKVDSAVQNFGGGLAQGFGQNFKQAFAEAAPAVDKAGKAIKEVGEKSAITRGEIREISTVMRELGAGPLANITRLLGGVGVSFGSFALVGVAIAGIGAAMLKAADGASETEKALTDLSKVSGTSFENLSAMQLVFEQGGTSAKQFAKEIGNLFDKIAEEAPKAALDVASSADKVIEAQNKAYGGFSAADLAFSKQKVAIEQYKSAVANNLGPVITQFQQLADGFKQSFDPLTTVETKTKAITILLGQTGTSLSDLNRGFLNAGKDGQAALLKLADILKNLSSDSERLAIGKKLGLSPETIETLSRGSAALKQQQEEMQHLGVTLDNVDQGALKQFREGQSEVSTLLSALYQKMGALASPAFTTFFQALSDAIKKAVPDFTRLAQVFGQIDFTGFAQGLVKIGLAISQSLVGLAKLISGEVALGDVFKEVGNQLVAIAVKIGKAFAEGFINAVVGVLEDQYHKFVDPLVEAWDKLVDFAGKTAQKISQIFVAAFNAILDPIKGVITTIMGWINALLDKINKALAGVKGLLSPSGGTAPDTGGLPMASGGLVQGRGGIDSNLAWLTQGEYVINASAVRAIGLNALNAINAGFAPRFASGGLNIGPRLAPVPSATSSGQRVLNLSIEGRSFSGLSIPEHTAQSLERFAVHSQLASAGRKQSWRR